MNGTYQDSVPLANITIAGGANSHQSMSFHMGGVACDTSGVKMKKQGNSTHITGLENASKNGAWHSEMSMKLT